VSAFVIDGFLENAGAITSSATLPVALKAFLFWQFKSPGTFAFSARQFESAAAMAFAAFHRVQSNAAAVSTLEAYKTFAITTKTAPRDSGPFCCCEDSRRSAGRALRSMIVSSVRYLCPEQTVLTAKKTVSLSPAFDVSTTSLHLHVGAATKESLCVSVVI